ncbi:consortin-like [Saccostrea echinata]|uniref:consortin-like n=1 Tax=Saccostrea echinata TaxID=191078 RepID=UPI002A83A97B|nr:consortin-like [Saccostrea echinata]
MNEGKATENESKHNVTDIPLEEKEDNADAKENKSVTNGEKLTGMEESTIEEPLSSNDTASSLETGNDENGDLLTSHRQPGDGEHEEKETPQKSGTADIKEDVTVTEEEDDEGIDVSDGSDLDGEGRIKLFKRGLDMEKKEKLKSALKCYMACLRGLKPHSNFPLLPQCLRNIADIFYRQEEYEKAIHFIQAEKIYYESALIDTTDIQKKLEDAQRDQELPADVSEETIRADEFEELARICLDEKQPQLALEYAGKATKIRQSVLGDNHPITINSLDFFTQVYAEAGADQYQDSMKRFENQEDIDLNDSSAHTEIPGTPEKEPQSILRRRKPGEKDAEKRVRFEESVIQNEDEEQCAKVFVWILFAICGVILLILGLYLYCHISSGSTCTSYKYQIKYIWDRVKYYYYHYTQSKLRKFV